MMHPGNGVDISRKMCRNCNTRSIKTSACWSKEPTKCIINIIKEIQSTYNMKALIPWKADYILTNELFFGISVCLSVFLSFFLSFLFYFYSPPLTLSVYIFIQSFFFVPFTHFLVFWCRGRLFSGGEPYFWFVNILTKQNKTKQNRLFYPASFYTKIYQILYVAKCEILLPYQRTVTITT
jgi:hypothetical protein